MIKLGQADARRFLMRHHFADTTVEGVFDRLGSVQFDPLKPLGCNHDLVLQARVPGYRVDDWRHSAYQQRIVYDGWDKQASLVRITDWPVRRIFHKWHQPYWKDRVLDAYPDAVEAVLCELHSRGPLSGAEFNHQVHKEEWQGSWYGPRLTQNVLRALWHTGRIVTHDRKMGRHVYDLAERVVPRELYTAPPVGERESVRWLITLRHQAVGLLRPAGNPYEVWSLPLKATERKNVIAELVAEGLLVPVEVEGKLFHATAANLAKLDEAPPTQKLRFLGPLDQLLWDRQAVRHLFEFDYAWEVYKPAKSRRWGYYVLPVLWRDRFVARFDARVTGTTWHLQRWWWERDVKPDAELLAALAPATRAFRHYLRVDDVRVAPGVDAKVREAVRAGVRET